MAVESVLKLTKEYMIKGKEHVEGVEENCKFLLGSEIVAIDGENFLMKDGRFINEVIFLTEEELVRDWIQYFAIGRVGKKNYFPFSEWEKLCIAKSKEYVEITKQPPKAVVDSANVDTVILGKDNEMLFVIRSVVMAIVTPEEKHAFQIAGMHMSHNRHSTDPLDIKKRNDETANYLKDKIVYNDDENHLSNRIPDWFYRKHNVSPIALQQVTFIKDELLPGATELTLTTLKDILTEAHLNKKITHFDLGLLNKATANTLKLPEDVEVVNQIHREKIQPTQSNKSDFDLFEG